MRDANHTYVARHVISGDSTSLAAKPSNHTGSSIDHRTMCIADHTYAASHVVSSDSASIVAKASNHAGSSNTAAHHARHSCGRCSTAAYSGGHTACHCCQCWRCQPTCSQSADYSRIDVTSRCYIAGSACCHAANSMLQWCPPQHCHLMMWPHYLPMLLVLALLLHLLLHCILTAFDVKISNTCIAVHVVRLHSKHCILVACPL